MKRPDKTQPHPADRRLGGSIGHYVYRQAQAWLDLLFPPACYGCLAYSPTGHPLCWRCLDRIEPMGEVSACIPSPDDWSDSALRIYCAWRFDRVGPVPRLIHCLKYDNRPWLGDHLGIALAKMLSKAGLSPVDLVVPVPLHHVKMLERGYNQASWIGASLAREFGLPFESDALRRKRHVVSQTRLSRNERWANVRTAFAAANVVMGKRILVVDDVITTGATVYAAARSLLQAGARHVEVAAVALSAN